MNSITAVPIIKKLGEASPTVKGGINTAPLLSQESGGGYTPLTLLSLHTHPKP